MYHYFVADIPANNAIHLSNLSKGKKAAAAAPPDGKKQKQISFSFYFIF